MTSDCVTTPDRVSDPALTGLIFLAFSSRIFDSPVIFLVPSRAPVIFLIPSSRAPSCIFYSPVTFLTPSPGDRSWLSLGTFAE